MLRRSLQDIEVKVWVSGRKINKTRFLSPKINRCTVERISAKVYSFSEKPEESFPQKAILCCSKILFLSGPAA
ncbi:hypothetical protein LguiB_029073 [Lonicera macranthoides]